jgi:hypothetical protein
MKYIRIVATCNHDADLLILFTKQNISCKGNVKVIAYLISYYG